MKKKHTFSLINLRYLYAATPVEPLPSDRSVVIFSDFHMGDGSKKDDFLNNADLTIEVLKEYYRRGHLLILNGDIEELQKFNREKIRRRWSEVFDLFARFRAEGRLIRLAGNHDLDMLFDDEEEIDIREGVRYALPEEEGVDGRRELFIFHGHQASRFYALFNDQLGMMLKYLLRPLPFKNFSVSHDNRKKKRLEERVYSFSNSQHIVSIIGHTHRPLFESLSKSDYVKYNIERLCRQYSTADAQEKEAIQGEINDLKQHLEENRPEAENDIGSIYHGDFVVPCVFNSGCVLGKRGITCIELSPSDISLVYWFDERRSRRYIRYEGYQARQLGDTDYYETVIKSEKLDYVFSRINLLA